MSNTTPATEFKELTELIHDLVHHTETAETIDRQMVANGLHRCLYNLILAEHLTGRVEYYQHECLKLLSEIAELCTQNSQLLRHKRTLQKFNTDIESAHIHGYTGHA